jgi:hypothetical protein
MKFSLAFLALPLAVGCSSSQPQVLTGRVAPGFPAAVTSVNIIKGSSIVASAPVAADGSFRLSVPAGSSYSIRLVSTGQTALVFPRHSGTVASTFAIRSGGVSFDLGAIYYLGTSTPTFAFHDGASSGTCDGEDHDSSGATCVDDGDATEGTCDAGDSESESGDGSDGGSDAAEPADSGDAVAEHNFPADGCADGNDNGGDDSAEGSDSADSGAGA